MISKSLSTSEKRATLHQLVPKLAEFCQALYPLLVAHADDFGRLPGDVFTVKHLVDPTSPRKTKDFTEGLRALHQVGLVNWYEAEGRQTIEIMDFERHQSGLHKKTGSAYPEPLPWCSGNGAEVPGNSRLTELNRTELNLTEGKGREGGLTATRLTPEELGVMWNQIAREVGLRTQMGLEGRRRIEAHARIRERPDPEHWRLVIARIAASDFCRGANDRGWIADFDFLVRRSTALKVLEGKYDNRAVGAMTPANGAPKLNKFTAAAVRAAQHPIRPEES